MYYVDGELLLVYVGCLYMYSVYKSIKAADNNGKLGMKSIVCIHHTLYSSCIRIVS